MLRDDPDLDALVAEARRPAAAEPGASIDGRVELPDISREPDPSPDWFPELVQRAVLDVQRGNGEHQAVLGEARVWSRWLLGPGRTTASYEDLAKRHAVAHLVNLRATSNLAACAAARIVDEAGVQTLATRGRGVVIGFLRNGVQAATAMVTLRLIQGRGAFAPGTAEFPEQKMASPYAAWRQGLEAVGVRFIGPTRQPEVIRRLLEEGEICVVPAALVGTTDGTLLERPVRTTEAPAALAKDAGVPLVIVGSLWDSAGIEVRVSDPILPDRFDSARAMHAAAMEQIDAWLRDAPEQLLTQFPAAELALVIERLKELGPEVREAKRVEQEAQAGLREKQGIADSSEDSEVEDAAEILREARISREVLTAEMRELKVRLQPQAELRPGEVELL